FGRKSLTLANGATLDVVNTIRDTISTRIIQQYYSYCQKTISSNFKILGESSLFAILQVCAASTRKSMAGIDNYAANGFTGFDNLKKKCDELAVFHVSIDKVVQLQKTLQKCRNYIKIDYKTHMSNSSTIADHCSVFGLSDSKDNDWNEECNHTHTDKCEDCCLLDNTLAEIELILKDNDEMTEAIRLRHLTLFNRQQAVHDAALASLDDTSPAVAYKLMLTFCHVFNNCLQNSSTVISILEDVLKRIKFDHPEVETAYIMRDNAGCYHDSETLLAVKALFDSTGIFIRRIDFSKPQAGVNALHIG
ncbi:unnamed protein product, partial [Rotaria magnacalcarata]